MNEAILFSEISNHVLCSCISNSIGLFHHMHTSYDYTKHHYNRVMFLLCMGNALHVSVLTDVRL